MTKRPSRSIVKLFKSKPVLAVIPLICVAVVITILEFTNTTHLFHKTAIPPIIPTTSSSSSKQQSSVSTDKNAQQEPSSTSKDTASTTPTKSTSDNVSKVTLPLYTPYGDFVSNHHPNLSGSPAPSKETSVCNTTPGASCSIRLTMGSANTSLPSQVTDSKGVAYWEWDVKKANLTVGDWTVTAVASLNGQTKTTQDPLPLTVGK